MPALINRLDPDLVDMYTRPRSGMRTILTDTFRADTEISLWDLARELRRTLPHGSETIPKQIDHAVLRRTRPPLLLGAPIDVINEINTLLATLTEDEQRHFIPKAQGGELGEQSWYFEGRHTEARQITAWLRTHHTGMLVITGPAGSGKSALLGHLITQTHPALRHTLNRHGLLTTASQDERPPDNTFDTVLHLTGLTTMDIVRRLATTAGLHAVPDSLNAALPSLTESIAHHGQLTIVVDALDEAVEPLTVAGAVIRPLAQIAGVRIVIGTRRSTLEGPDHPQPTDDNLLHALGVPEDSTITVTTDGTAIGRYVHKRLTIAADRKQFDAPPSALIDASIAIGTSGKPFLFARLAVHELIATPTLLAAIGINQLLAADHRQLFSLAVDRLTRHAPQFRSLLAALAFARGRGLPIRDGIWACVATALRPETPIEGADITHLLTAAAPYLLLDREHDQTVYRLAHRTFAEHFTSETTLT
ncbi:hypothetical protein ACFQ1S_13730, partial [Kibdelosporangium lantanae]